MSRNMASFLVALALLCAFFTAQQYLMPYYYAATIEDSILNKYPLMTLISKKSPVEFNKYITQLKANILNHGDQNNEFFYSAALVNSEFSKYATKASDQSLYHFLGSEIHLYKRLYQSNPAFVLFIEFPGKFRSEINSSALNNDLNNKDVGILESAKEAVITSGLNNNRLLAFNDAEQNMASVVLKGVMTNLDSKYGAPLVSESLLNPDTATLDQRKTAEIIISYYEQIYAEGPTKAGEVLRVIFATNNATAAR